MKKQKGSSIYIHKVIYDDKNKYDTPNIDDLKIHKLYFSKEKNINLNSIEAKSCNRIVRQSNKSRTNSKNKNITYKNLSPKLDEMSQRNSKKQCKTILKKITYNINSSSRKKMKLEKNSNSGINKILNNKKTKFLEKQIKKPLKILILKHKFDRSHIENGNNKTIDISIKNFRRSKLIKKYFQENENKNKNIDASKIKLDTSDNIDNINHYFIDTSLKAESRCNKIKLSMLPKVAIDISQSKQNKRYKNMNITFNCDDVINFGVKLKHQNLTPEMIKEIKELDSVISDVINEYNNCTNKI